LKKNAPKLVIHRETLRNLDLAALTGGQHAAVPTQGECVSTSANDGCPTLSWGVSICGCEPSWGFSNCGCEVTEAGPISG
jgi:hypothetical protein